MSLYRKYIIYTFIEIILNSNKTMDSIKIRKKNSVKKTQVSERRTIVIKTWVAFTADLKS